MLWIEMGLVLLALLVAAIRPSLGDRWFEKWERRFSALAQRRVLSVFLVGLLTLFLRVAVLPVEPIPEPAVHDEFAYLLQADTFAHGRLTNPTPPMWVHFETFHVIFQPTYCAKFFPGQALFLALGKVLFGHPFWGVWLSCGLMCAAITWMLQGWMSAEWALLGGLLSVLRWGVFSYWANSYWGGAVAAIGGALVVGALPRIKQSQRIRDALWMGIGLALLANTRPWEGLVLSVPVAVMLFAWMFGKKRPALGISLQGVILPIGALIVLNAAWLAYYNWRTTGNATRTAYQVYEKQYEASPYMVWQHIPRQPIYYHEIIRTMYIKEALAGYYDFHSPVAHMMRVLAISVFFFGPGLMLPFLALIFILPHGFSWRHISRPVRLLLLLALIFGIGTELAIFYNPHYSAPGTGVLLAMTIVALRQIRSSSNAGLFISRAVPAICIVSFAIWTTAEPLHVPTSQLSSYEWCQFFKLHPPGWFPRAKIQSKLAELRGGQLVIVRYKRGHKPFPEWVYNYADIENAKVVWARAMSPKEDTELIDYFKNRQVWLLTADDDSPQIVPYSTQLPRGQNVSYQDSPASR